MILNGYDLCEMPWIWLMTKSCVMTVRAVGVPGWVVGEAAGVQAASRSERARVTKKIFLSIASSFLIGFCFDHKQSAVMEINFK